MELETFVEENLPIKYTLPKGKTVLDVVSLLCYGKDRAGWHSRTAKVFVSQFAEYIPRKRYITWFLQSRGYKYCNTCGLVLSLQMFYREAVPSIKNNGYCSKCITCNKQLDKFRRKENSEPYRERSRRHYSNNKSYYIERNLKRDQVLHNRVVPWSEKELIKEFYSNRPEGHHVDHIIPLQGELVSGLHVIGNLQYLTAEDNLRKGNKHEN